MFLLSAICIRCARRRLVRWKDQKRGISTYLGSPVTSYPSSSCHFLKRLTSSNWARGVELKKDGFLALSSRTFEVEGSSLGVGCQQKASIKSWMIKLTCCCHLCPQPYECIIHTPCTRIPRCQRFRE